MTTDVELRTLTEMYSEITEKIKGTTYQTILISDIDESDIDIRPDRSTESCEVYDSFDKYSQNHPHSCTKTRF